MGVETAWVRLNANGLQTVKHEYHDELTINSEGFPHKSLELGENFTNSLENINF